MGQKYCPNCGSANSYSLKEPDSCSTCHEPLNRRIVAKIPKKSAKLSEIDETLDENVIDIEDDSEKNDGIQLEFEKIDESKIGMKEDSIKSIGSLLPTLGDLAKISAPLPTREKPKKINKKKILSELRKESETLRK